VRRFQGETLPERPRIAVVANDALGNYVVSTPLLQMLRAKYPDATLDYYGGSRTQVWWYEEHINDHGFDLFGTATRESAQQVARDGVYDLVVNLEFSDWAKAFAAIAAGDDGFVVGPCIGRDGRDKLPFADDERGALAADPEWVSPDLRTKYPFLESSFIGEIFCRLAYLDGPVPGYRLPSEKPPFPVPEVLIATTASLPEKLWPSDRWKAVLSALKTQGKTAGLLGAKPSAQQRFWRGNEAEQSLVDDGLAEDLRGRLTLPQVVGALAQTRQVLTLDNGILHLAASTSTPIVGLFREGIHRLWAPPAPNLRVLTPQPGGAVAEITPERVLEALDGA
jgi:ADP-heptose:LPS heptosyltransferase